jgi:hypothetical protein
LPMSVESKAETVLMRQTIASGRDFAP